MFAKGRILSLLVLVAMLAAVVVPAVQATGPLGCGSDQICPPPHTLEIDGDAWTTSPVVTLSGLPGSAYVGDTVVVHGTLDLSNSQAWAWVAVPNNEGDPRTIVGDALLTGGTLAMTADGKPQIGFAVAETWSMIDNGIQDPSSPEVWGDIGGQVVTFDLILTRDHAGKMQIQANASEVAAFAAFAFVNGKYVLIGNVSISYADFVWFLEWINRSMEWKPGNRKVVLQGFPTGYSWVNFLRLDTAGDGFAWTAVPSGRPMDQQPVSGPFNYEFFLDPQGSQPGVYSAQACNERACTEWRGFAVSPAPFDGADVYVWGDLPQVTMD